MEKQTKQTHLLMLAMCWFAIICMSRTVNGEEEFNYDPCSERGPKHWGELKEEWAKCENGKIQSPISLSKWTADSNRSLGNIKRNHKPNNAVLRNVGYEIHVDWSKEDAGSIKINNIAYDLYNYHWHIPSEHTQDGKTFPLELHMVHINNNPNLAHNIAVIGVLFEYGPRDPFIYQIEKALKQLTTKGGEINLGKVDPKVAKLVGKEYFRYIGSLTTPPCTEGVIWTVMKQVQTVLPYQVELLKQAMIGETNARPLQEINDRDVFYFDRPSWRSAANFDPSSWGIAAE